MARGKNKRSINGVIFLDKPQGISSNQALQKVRWLFQAEKAGHGGTLDPFAEGALPILLGEATKFGQCYLLGRKQYRVTLQFGYETTTDDREGEPTIYKPCPNFDDRRLKELLASFVGKQWQSPPIYSALKVDGRRAYELARKGKAVELADREIEIYQIEIYHIDHEQDHLTLDVTCSKGTYIRALVRDIARQMESAAHAKFLRRLQIGESVQQLYNLEYIESLKEIGQDLTTLLLPTTDCVAHLPKLDVSPHKLIYIRNGNDIEIDQPQGEYALYGNGVFFGVGIVDQDRLYPKRLCRLEASS